MQLLDDLFRVVVHLFELFFNRIVVRMRRLIRRSRRYRRRRVVVHVLLLLLLLFEANILCALSHRLQLLLLLFGRHVRHAMLMMWWFATNIIILLIHRLLTGLLILVETALANVNATMGALLEAIGYLKLLSEIPVVRGVIYISDRAAQTVRINAI